MHIVPSFEPDIIKFKLWASSKHKIEPVWPLSVRTQSSSIRSSLDKFHILTVVSFEPDAKWRPSFIIFKHRVQCVWPKNVCKHSSLKKSHTCTDMSSTPITTLSVPYRVRHVMAGILTRRSLTICFVCMFSIWVLCW